MTIQTFQQIRQKLEGYQPPHEFQPIKVAFDIGSPFLMGDRWYHGDSLLASVLMQEVLGDDYHDLPAKQPLPVADWLKLPLKRSGPIYHSSTGLLDSDLMKVTTLYKRFAEDDRSGIRGRIHKGSGHFKDYMMKMPYSPSKSITFYMNGDLGEVKRLCRYIKFLGKKHAVGSGEVVRCHVEAIPEDYSLIREGKAMREIPIDMLKSYDINSIMLRAVIWPYWNIEHVTEVIAPGGACEL